MAVFTADNRKFWQDLADTLSMDRPSVGKTVRVTGGRKHLSKVGVVVYHGVDKFSDAFRYADEAQTAYREMAGRYGYIVKIKQDDGSTFWIKADSVAVVK